MHVVEIMWPMDRGRIVTPITKGSPFFFASGFAHKDDEQIHGKLLLKGESFEEKFDGQTILTLSRRRKKGPREEIRPEDCRWLILFKLTGVPAGQDFTGTLTVDGARSTEKTVSFTIHVPQERAKSKGSATHAGRQIDIDPAIQPGDIPAEGFVAYGTIVEHTVSSVTMNEIAADFVWGGPEEGTWSAQFPPLQVGTYYQLKALDSFGHVDSVENLRAT